MPNKKQVLSPPKELNLKPTEIAWLAGLLEGEGSFGLDRRSSTKYIHSTSPPAPYIQLSMVDEDIIKRVADLVDKKYHKLNRKTNANKHVFKVPIGDRATLRALLPDLLPYFGLRRKANVQECLVELQRWEQWYINGGRSQSHMAKSKYSARKNSKL